MYRCEYAMFSEFCVNRICISGEMNIQNKFRGKKMNYFDTCAVCEWIEFAGGWWLDSFTIGNILMKLCRIEELLNQTKRHTYR